MHQGQAPPARVARSPAASHSVDSESLLHTMLCSRRVQTSAAASIRSGIEVLDERPIRRRVGRRQRLLFVAGLPGRFVARSQEPADRDVADDPEVREVRDVALLALILEHDGRHHVARRPSSWRCLRAGATQSSAADRLITNTRCTSGGGSNLRAPARGVPSPGGARGPRSTTGSAFLSWACVQNFSESTCPFPVRGPASWDTSASTGRSRPGGTGPGRIRRCSGRPSAGTPTPGTRRPGGNTRRRAAIVSSSCRRRTFQ